MPLPWQKDNRSLEDIQQEDEKLTVELSVAQKRALLAKLNDRGLSVKRDFGGSLKAAWAWFKSH